MKRCKIHSGRVAKSAERHVSCVGIQQGELYQQKGTVFGYTLRMPLSLVLLDSLLGIAAVSLKQCWTHAHVVLDILLAKAALSLRQCRADV